MNSPQDPYLRSNELLSHAQCRLLVVDVQEKLIPAIPVADRLIFECSRLIRAARLFEIPVHATEQYPKGLGGTVPELAQLLDSPADKLRFSCGEVLNWGAAADQTDGRYKVLVIGMEAHVCVLQTVLDLLAGGYQVYVAADAVASRKKMDWQIALRRMEASGAVILTAESAMFEWCEASGSETFRQISKLIQESPPGE
ncbi:Isochorismatase family protein [Symmachiella dynata]|uniref:Isochorismatase family protein n=1 Tax=Symmachiella dynata TaxID=2527995 RepID=A0A517ZIT4_9PLAN|nr:hydrolase [Symmachiella dynata]QDU42392.1 Isochorismatase family protein [Symmachiella dynata]